MPGILRDYYDYDQKIMMPVRIVEGGFDHDLQVGLAVFELNADGSLSPIAEH